MSISDWTKTLFRNWQKRDDTSFFANAKLLIAEERRKNHIGLAHDLEVALGNSMPGPVPVPKEFMMSLAGKDNLVEALIPTRDMDTIILSTDTQLVLNNLITEYPRWEKIVEKGAKPTQRILFCGPSGCGKTVTAEALAKSLNLTLLYVRLDALIASFLGDTAKNIGRVFDVARTGQYLLFFDEFDAIGRSRDESAGRDVMEMSRVVSAFLQLLDRYHGKTLIVAATNFSQSIDPAIWRRFDEVVFFPNPSPAGRCNLVKKLAPNYPGLLDHMEKEARATFADIEYLCNRIRIHDICSGEPLDRIQLNQFVNIMNRKINNRYMLSEYPVLDSRKEIE